MFSSECEGKVSCLMSSNYQHTNICTINIQCAAGYYCPSYLTRPPDAPAYAVFSGEPHTQAAGNKRTLQRPSGYFLNIDIYLSNFSIELECGDVRYFCPRGTFYPIKVGGGNFSIGGNTNNRTRSAQLICSPGSYCSGAISILCPPGRYGNATGLAARECTGIFLVDFRLSLRYK